MSTTVYLQILALIILIILNGILSMAEMAIVSSRKTKLQKMVNDGKKKAKIAIELIEDPNQFLSTIQIGITLIGILTGAVGGSSISYFLGDFLSVYTPYGDIIAMLIVVILITYFTLVIGELVPKRVSLNNPENIAVRTARAMQILSKICGPLVTILSKTTDFVLKIIGSNKVRESLVTEDEIKLLIEEGIQDGTIEKEEEDIIKRVFRLDDQKVDTLMTPRTDIIWIDLDDGVEELKRKVIDSERSIFPVAKGELDDLIGVIQTKDILSSLFIDNKLNIEECLKQPLIIPENLPSLNILKQFKENKEYVHMAMVVDEYGSIEGLITLNDVLEGIVGDIPGIDENDDPTITLRRDGTWLIDGSLSIDRFKEQFELEEDMPQENEDNYTTLAGFILSYIGKVPEEGEQFQWKIFEFEILDMDGHHIDKVLVKELKQSQLLD
ncbi:hemolysin family protein [Methanobrevibacter filiformis]|uniref:Magnesium and cobalt efflux protein CorC n=1 Tax=Methanobrevibacter filiformis TaxID=55758 RepID=A0A166ESR9_9EURY|nr:hemolysin family protein [Methanobrevibacter filiformis]KZX16969.1 magnesium and cobalt efflux protein CorC [Methanobrevibacter filiformis]